MPTASNADVIPFKIRLPGQALLSVRRQIKQHKTIRGLTLETVTSNRRFSVSVWFQIHFQCTFYCSLLCHYLKYEGWQMLQIRKFGPCCANSRRDGQEGVIHCACLWDIWCVSWMMRTTRSEQNTQRQLQCIDFRTAQHRFFSRCLFLQARTNVSVEPSTPQCSGCGVLYHQSCCIYVFQIKKCLIEWPHYSLRWQTLATFRRWQECYSP